MSRYILLWLIPLALLNGLLFLILLPPWQHYDEPTHFEYAALIAYHGGIPTAQAVDPQLRREIAASMYRHNFYPPGVVPDLFSAIPAPLGFDQTVHPPLYYTLAALPIRLTRFLPIEWQLYAARLLSLSLYVAAIVIAWRIATVVTPDEPLVHGIIPALLLAAPSYADLMTAINNDVLVNVAAISALLAMAHLLRDGLRPTPLLLLGLAVTVALMTKRTGLILLPMSALALFWGWRRTAFNSRQQLLLGLAALGSLAGLGLASLQISQTAAGSLVFILRPWLVALDTTYLRLGLERWINPAGAFSVSLDQLRSLAEIGFNSFWLRFGWGQLSLGTLTDRVMLILVLSCMVGLIVLAYQQRGRLSAWESRWILLMFVSVILGWLSLAVRFEVGLDNSAGGTYVPRGRYIFTVMLPHLWVLALGWQGLFPAAWRRYSLFVLLAMFTISTLATWFMLFDYFWL